MNANLLPHKQIQYLYVHILYVRTYVCTMKIEEAIKSSFQSEIHKVAVNLLYTSSWMNYKHSHLFKDQDLTMQQYNVLRILKGQYPNAATVNLIIDRMIDKSSNASRIVEKLRQKGWVERTACETDRRRVDVKITEKGLQVLENMAAIMDDYPMGEDVLTMEEQKELNRLLDKLRTTKF